MNWILPRLSATTLRVLACYALASAGVAGVYGIVHDQCTYTLSPEYFEKLKFHQFAYANFGFSPRVFVGEVGFLATWWAGLVAAWFLGRLLVPVFRGRALCRRMSAGLGMVILGTLLGGLLGWGWGFHVPVDDDAWLAICAEAGVTDQQAFIRVAYIHNAGYGGALVGLLIALAWARRQVRAVQG